MKIIVVTTLMYFSKNVHVSMWKILNYYRIDVYEGIDFSKESGSKKSIICHYWYISNKGFNLQSLVCNCYHDILMTSLNLNNICIFNIYGVDYLCIITGINKSEAINLLEYDDVSKEIRIIIKYKNTFILYKRWKKKF